MIAILITLILFLAPALTRAQAHSSPYAGQEKRKIKSLSSGEIKGYLSGRGMGFAKAAELNHYPGPKHVLVLSDELHLTKEQIEESKKVFAEMKKAATQLGEKYIQKERELDLAFANEIIDEGQLKVLLIEAGQLRGEIRFAHLKAHLKMKLLLSSEQVAKYDELRGYKDENVRGKSHDQQH